MEDIVVSYTSKVEIPFLDIYSDFEGGSSFLGLRSSFSTHPKTQGRALNMAQDLASGD